MNWRRPFIFAALAATRSEIPEALKKISLLAMSAPETVAGHQKVLLEKLLCHAWQRVPYYRRLLEEAGVVAEGEIHLENFTRLPLLDKRLIRENGQDLRARGRRRGEYANTSGGSTGEPVRLLQDRHYSDWNIANTIHYKTFADQQPGDPEIRLWGSERDLKGSRSLGGALRDLAYHRRDLNTFRMTIRDMERYVEIINRTRPGWIEAYAQSAFELARFIKATGRSVHPPCGVLTSAGNLYPEMRSLIEEVFACTVYNRYGSREVGGMACSCDRREGLHLSPWNHFLEIVDEEGQVVPPGGRGRVCVTVLRNLTMPLIRYDIGDVATSARAGHEICSCGRTGMPLIQDVQGRDVAIFATPGGTKVDGELFAHLLYFRVWCRRFQAVQLSPDELVVRVVVMDGMEQEFERDRIEIEKELVRLLGTDCRTGLEAVPEIEPVPSGKHLDTVIEVS